MNRLKFVSLVHLDVMGRDVLNNVNAKQKKGTC